MDINQTAAPLYSANESFPLFGVKITEHTLYPEQFPIATSTSTQVLTYITAIICLISAVLNGGVWYVFLRERKLWSASNILLVWGLVFAEFMFNGTSGPILLHNAIHKAYLSANECRVQGFAALFFGSTGVLCIFATSVERYYAIVKQKPLTSKQLGFWLAFAWIGGAIIGVFPAFAGLYAVRPTHVTCTAAWWSRIPLALIYTLSCFFALGTSMSVTAFVYIKTFKKVRAHASEVAAVMQRQRADAESGTALVSVKLGWWGRIKHFWLNGEETEGQADEEDGTSSSGATSSERRGTKKGKSGGRDEHASGSAANNNVSKRTQKKRQLERTVFNRSLRIVGAFYAGWMLHNLLFIYEIITGKPVPYVFDWLAHANVAAMGLVNPIILVAHSKPFYYAVLKYLPFLKFVGMREKEDPVVEHTSDGPSSHLTAGTFGPGTLGKGKGQRVPIGNIYTDGNIPDIPTQGSIPLQQVPTTNAAIPIPPSRISSNQSPYITTAPPPTDLHDSVYDYLHYTAAYGGEGLPVRASLAAREVPDKSMTNLG